VSLKFGLSNIEREILNTLTIINGLSKAAGGTANTVPSLLNALSRLNTNQFLVNLRVKQDGESNEPDPHRVNTIHVDGFKISFIRWAPQLSGAIQDLCRKEKIELIHVHGVWQTHTAVQSAKKLNIPLVITTHGMLSHHIFSHKAWKKIPGWWLYQKKDLETARAVHITSRAEGDDLRKIGFKGPLALIPIAAEIPEWREPDLTPKNVRTALYFARLHLKKGLMNLVEAWATARPKGWRMRIVGPDYGYGEVVKTAVKKLGLENEFSFQGPVYGEAKWEVYRNADLFILPSFSESFGIVIPEAMACGLPVITTHGTPWEELNKFKCGWWIPIGVEPLAEALRQATEASDWERREMGLRGRKLVEQNYTWDSTAQKLVVLYKWMLKGGPAPPFVRFD
jgi:glycosyltransferase involved in cell wall biosynthesis